MTQLFTNEGLGIKGSSLSQLGSYGPKGNAALGQSGESVYTNAANGNLVLRQKDGFLASTGLGFELVHSYNSLGEGGNNWRFNTQTSLSLHGVANSLGSKLIRIDEDGHASQFTFDETKGCYLASDGSTGTLRFEQDRWIYREGSDARSYQYNVDGQLTCLRDRDGHQLQFNYREGQLDSIIDTSDKQTIKWVFDNGFLQDLNVLSDGEIIHHLHYDYDAQHRLQKVTRDLGQGKVYWISYDYVSDSNQISAIRQSDGTSLLIDYDSVGRVKKLIDGEKRATNYEYFDGRTVIRNGLGETWTYYYDQQSRLTAIDGPENSPIRYEYTGQHLTAVHQANLHWLFDYNEAGDCITVQEPSGQMTKRVYDNEHRLLSETSYTRFDGNHSPETPETKHFIYDERGHLRFLIAKDGTVSEYRYNQEGQCLTSRTYLKSGYSTCQQKLELNDLLTWVSEQDSQTISLSSYHYDWRGLLDVETHYASIDENGEGSSYRALVTGFRYDAAGRLVEKAVPLNQGFSITSYLYDDLGRLIQSCDNQNHFQRFEYDDMHQRIVETNARGLQTIRSYDHSGLLLTTQYLDSNKRNYGTIQYAYDAAGQLQSETHIDGSVSYYFYDEEGRLQAKCEPGGQLTEYRYDEEGRLVQTINYSEKAVTADWKTKIPEWTEIKPKNTLDDRISQIIYNDFNQIAYQINAEGAVLAFDYNPAGQVICKTAYAIRLESYIASHHLTINELKLQLSDNDRSIYYFYDSEGRLQAEVNGEGAAISYRYDRRGNLLESIRYANHPSFTLNSKWVVPEKNDNDIHSFSLFNTAGLKVADIDPEGFAITYEYNDRGLLIQKRSFSTVLTETVFVKLHENTVLTDLNLQEKASDHLTTYRYDDLDQLIEERSQNGLLVQFRYDENGLVLEKTLTDTKTQEMRQQRFRYDTLGRVIQQLDALGAALLLKNPQLAEAEIETIWLQHSLHYEYDLSGRVVSLTNALKQTTRYFYNEAGLLTYTVNAEGQVTENHYNHFNQVETVYRYSKSLKQSLRDLTTAELATQLDELRDESSDEKIVYEYNTLGQLVKKLTGSRGLQTIEYNAFGELELTSLSIDQTHELVKGYAYDRRGLVRHQADDIGGVNRHTETQYDVFGNVKKIIDPRGGITSYLYNRRGEKIIIENPAKIKKEMDYDAFGRILSETNSYNNFSYDDQNNTLTIQHPGQKSKIVTQFNAFGDKIAVTDANGQTTRYYYDAKAQLITESAPQSQAKYYHYDEVGHLIWQQDNGGQVIYYSYDAEGRLLTKTLDPHGLALTTKYHYDGIGRQLEITEASGLRKQFSYDDSGNLIQTRTDPDGLNLTILFTYDDRGLLTRKTECSPQGKDRITAYEWDILGGRKATILDPDGLSLRTSYSYDENGNLISETDANNNTRHFIYDAKNQCRFQIDARGVVTEHIYDANGNEYQTLIYANRISALKSYTEKELRLVLKPADNDQYQFRLFDIEGRVTLSFDAQGYGTSYDYDGNGNLLHLSRFAAVKSLGELKKGVFELSKEERALARHRYFAYNGLNQLVYQLDEKNYLTEYSYNASGQMISKIKFATNLALESAHYSLDLLRKNIQTSPFDQCSRYAYDQAGRLSYQLSANGIANAYFYDGVGNTIASLQYATRFALDSKSDWEKQLSTCDQDRLTHFVFDAAGREVYRISPEGRVLERGYDALGNVTSEIAHGERLTVATYDEQGLRKVLKQDEQDRITIFNYDVIGRLTTKLDAKKQATHFAYDNNGNVLTKTEANAAQWTYFYDEANHLIETRSPSTAMMSLKAGQWVSELRSLITRHTYDSFGNVIATVCDPDRLNQIIQYRYDNNNRKIQTIYPNVSVNIASNQASALRQEQAQTLVEEQQYNAYGEVIASKDRAGNWRYNAYDKKGQLLYSLNAQGAVTGFSYDAVGNLLSKKRYANTLSWSTGIDDAETFAKSLQLSTYDREEHYSYDLDNRLVETTQKAVHSYNAATKHYETLTPTTRTRYNAFGEVIELSVKRNEIDWAKTNYYYDNDGLKQASLDAEHYLTTYSYGSFGELTDELQYANRANEWDESHVGIPDNSTKDRHVVFGYDELGRLTSKTLKQASYQQLINESNQYTTVASDLTTYYNYDALGNLTATTDALGLTSYCYYDALGQLIAKVGPATSGGRAATTYSYDPLGQLVEVTRFAQGAAFANKDSYVLNESSVADVSTHAIYDNQGRLLAEIDGLNHAVYYSYDANGQKVRSWQQLTQIDGSQRLIDKRYAYDKEGHLLQTGTFKNNGLLMTEDAVYNVFGEMTAKGIDGNLTTHIDYDFLGRIWRSNTQGYYQIFVYDLIDHLTQIVSSTNVFSAEYGDLGVDLSQERFNETERFTNEQWHFNLQRQNNSYDGLGRCLNQTKEFTLTATKLGEEVHLETISQQQSVDRWGNVLSHTSARGFETHYEYNAFDQVVKQELPEVVAFDEKMQAQTLKPIVYYAYDALGRAIAMTDANGHTVAKILDAEGRALTEIDAKGHQRIKTYNLLGHLVSNQNELGGITTYVYDKANRLTKVNSPNNQQTYTYDESGELIAQRNALDHSLLFWYDNLGHQFLKKDAGGRLSYSDYDDAGHKISEQDANGLVQTWTYDANGRLQSHTDLGSHTSTYQYNKNGLLLEETSTAGKSISYRYQGDGQILSYSDNVYQETNYYSYDADGNMITKSVSKTTQGSGDGGWITENDVYAYDALGRLTTVKRRLPQDKVNQLPDKDHALLSIDYQYDAGGNIRHTAVEANYTGYQKVRNDDFYTYDANNRMLINKGSFLNGEISLFGLQSSYLDYDAAGNVKKAYKFEDGAFQQYNYTYNTSNELEIISKNNIKLKTIHYDEIGRVDEERLYDAFGHAASITTMQYVADLLQMQSTITLLSGSWQQTEAEQYFYDAVGNLQHVDGRFYQNNTLIQRSHHYSYVYWDSYLQSTDTATQSIDNGPQTYGVSGRYYSVNGQLYQAVDGNNISNYKISTLEGIRARSNKNGQTSYLTVAGKTIGDLQLDNNGIQHLNVYGGFTPKGNARAGSTAAYLEDFGVFAPEITAYFLQRDGSLQNDTNNEILANTPQDNLGTYIVQAGDSLDGIALQVYGDSSLWYLIADSNGITDRQPSQLHNGQRITIPPVATRQHHNDGTRRIISGAELIGDTSATLPTPSLPSTTPTPVSQRRKSPSLFKKIAIAAITVIATVLAAAAFGALAGVIGASLSGGLGGALHLGMKVLAGQALGMTGSLAAGFAAGLAGNLAGQGLANILGLQKGIKLKGSLISGFSTAASAGLLQGLNSSAAFTNLLGKFDKLSPAGFSFSTAAQMMGEDAVSQGVSLALQNHQHFSWSELGARGILGGVAGSKSGRTVTQSLERRLGEAGGSIIHSELRALTTDVLQTAMNGENLNATQVLSDNLGSAIGNGFIHSQTAAIIEEQPESIEGEYCPTPDTANEENYSPIPKGFYERLHQETTSHSSIMEKMHQLWNDYEKNYIPYQPPLITVERNKESKTDSLTSGLGSFVQSALVNWTRQLGSSMWQAGKIGNRVEGAMEVAEGIGELATAAALIDGTFGGLALPGFVIGAHGSDKLITGIRRMFTGENLQLQTITALQKTPLSQGTIEGIDNVLSLTSILNIERRVAKENYFKEYAGPIGLASFEIGKGVKWGNLAAHGTYGGFSGGDGAVAVGGDCRDIEVGALIGSLVAIGGLQPRLSAFLSSPYISAGLSNLAGQTYSYLRDPQNNHYSLFYLGFSLAGARVSHAVTKEVNVGFSKAMIDSLINAPTSSVGYYLGKRTGL
ncbi:RHS repeat protein [Legionella drozanskii]|uniref:RHS repeat protein n=1 Tax=Legionella drozanskii TaxID=96228 RepID=UPI0010419BB1|nr:RHS repeat protein [Legionella drozanskii]